MNCPKCGFVQPDGMPDCQRCQIIFAKWQTRQNQAAQTTPLPEAEAVQAIPRPAPSRPVPPPPPPSAYAPSSDYTSPRPLGSTPSMKPLPGGDPFKAFTGTHTDSNRGGVDPYPHKKRKGQTSTYNGGPF